MGQCCFSSLRSQMLAYISYIGWSGFWCCWNVRGHGALVCKKCDLIVCYRHLRNGIPNVNYVFFILPHVGEDAWPCGLRWSDVTFWIFLILDVTFVKWRGHAVMWLSGAWCDLGRALVPHNQLIDPNSQWLNKRKEEVETTPLTIGNWY